MNVRTPITTAILTLGLACAPAFAGPAHPFMGPTTQTPSDMVQTSTRNLVVRVHKVYAFDQLDRNHNGMLTRAEIPADMKNLRRNFNRADFDHNGQLSPREYYLYSHGLSPNYIGAYHVFVATHRHFNPAVESIGLAR